MRHIVFALMCLGVAACNRVEPQQPDAVSGAPAAAGAATQAAAIKPLALAEMKPEQVAVTPALAAACNLEAIAGTVVPDMNPIEISGRTFTVSGWAVDEKSNAVPAALELRAYSVAGDGRAWQLTLPQGAERPDVQAVRGGAEGALNSGFSATVDAAGLPAGRYSLRLAYQSAGADTICDNGRSVVLK